MSDQILVGTRKGLFSINRAKSGNWEIAEPHLTGSPVPMVLHDQRDGRIYAAVKHGHFGSKLHRSLDGGRTWTETTVPAYPEPPPDAEEIRCPTRNIPIPWSLEMIWSLETGGADRPGVLWCGTIPGGLFRSEDGGDSWQLVRSLWDNPARREWFGGGYDYPGIHSICVDPRNADHVLVGISCGGTWKTADGGQTWACRADGMWAAYMPPEAKNNPHIQDPHRVVRCRDQPDVLWTQHHNGVFRSTDNSESWQDMTAAKPSVFGFAVVVHPADGQTAWLAPAVSDEVRIPVDGRLVVSRTRDGGETFEVLSNGLPQRHAYDLIYRHAMNIDETGDRLVMGSTTGSVFISEDQGDHWQLVTAHLPPVFCTRFV